MGCWDKGGVGGWVGGFVVACVSEGVGSCVYKQKTDLFLVLVAFMSNCLRFYCECVGCNCYSNMHLVTIHTLGSIEIEDP